jgi:VWFA-related protein
VRRVVRLPGARPDEQLNIVMMKIPFAVPVLFAVLAGPALAQAPEPSPSAAPPAAPAAGAPAADAAPAPRFPTAVEQVTVDVVVTDKKGAPVTGLTADDFQILEEDKPQKVASFESVQVPAAASEKTPERPRISTNLDPETRTGRSFVLVFDDIHLTPFQAHRAKAAVSEFLKSGVREGDRVSLVATGGGAWWTTRMEAGRDELISLVKRLDGRFIPDTAPDRMSDYEAMRIHIFRDAQVEGVVSRRFETFGVNKQQGNDIERFGDGDPLVRGRAAEIYWASVSRNRITLQILHRVLLSLAANKGRKAVILVSQGFIYDSNLSEFKDTILASRRANAAIYFLDTKGLGGVPDLYTSAEFGPNINTQDLGQAFLNTMQEAEGSESLASDSGGFTVRNTNDFARGIQRIANESRSYYLIGYTPSDQRRDGRFRKISVKLTRAKGLQVRARKGYYAPLDAALAASTVKPPVGDPDVQAALDSPYDAKEIPLRMTSYVFGETLLGKASVLVATEVDVRPFQFKEEDGRFVDSIEFLLIAAHRESGEFFRYDQKVDMRLQAETKDKIFRTWYPIVRDFELAPGGYQAKIVVRDKNSGRIGTVVHEFEVPALTQFRVSTPVLSDALREESDAKAPRPAVTARRSFAAGSTVYAQFEVYGAEKDKPTGMPRVTAGYEIRGADGTVALKVDPSRITPTSLGRLSRIVGSPLGATPPGSYEMVLTLVDEVAGKTLEVREPFTVEPAAAATAAN